MTKPTLAEALYSLVPDNALISIDAYNHGKPFRNTNEFINNGEEILEHHVNLFAAHEGVLHIELYD